MTARKGRAGAGDPAESLADARGDDRRPVLSLGEALIDLIVTDGATALERAVDFVARPGGAPANVAVGLARLGVPSAFGGMVGDDPFGARLRDTLAKEGVDFSRVHATNDAATTLAFAWKDSRGDGHFWLLRGADRLLTPPMIEGAALFGLAALVVGSVALAAEPSRAAITRAVELAHASGIPICFDVNVRPSLWPDMSVARSACAPILAQSKVVKLSLDDARHLFAAGDDPVDVVEQLATSATEQSPDSPVKERLIVLTDGGRGAWYASSGEAPRVRHVPAFAVEAVEPTGAGDAFTAALLSRLIARDWSAPDDDDLRYAAAAGALATTRPGAWEGLPSAAELAAFLVDR